MRRGVTGTAVAAVAMAALTASQAPGLVPSSSAPDEATPPPGTPISGGSPYYTELPPLVTPDKPGASKNLPPSAPDGTVVGGAGVPATVLAAYKKAEAALAKSHPGCNLPWELLAAIGQVESGQARRGNVDANGTTLAPIRGPQLNGNGFANIPDTDGGAYDGDTTHDRAVGPMQFIPSTWATWGADGNGDGENDPDNVFDAALAAGRYLCADGRDLSDPGDLDRAILGYNHSREYLRTVRSWLSYFKSGHREVPDNPARTGTGDGGSSSPKPGPSGSASSGSSGKGGGEKGSSGGKKPGREGGGSVKPEPRPTASASGSVRPVTPSPEPSTSDPSTCPTPEPSGSASPTPSDSASPTPSQTPSGSPSGSQSPSPSASPSDDPCASPSPSPSGGNAGSDDPHASAGASPSPQP